MPVTPERKKPIALADGIAHATTVGIGLDCTDAECVAMTRPCGVSSATVNEWFASHRQLGIASVSPHIEARAVLASELLWWQQRHRENRV
jgi:hypothetical protein